VLINLLSNAVKFTEKGKVLLVANVKDRQEGGKYTLQVDVIDTGIGISAEVQRKLFKAFCQADQSTSRVYGGTGLGLAISQSLVSLMKGEISVDSALGKGSKFSFTFETTVSNDNPVSSDSSRFKLPKDLATTLPLKILVSEDNIINQKLMSKLMKKMGYKVAVANNGQEAVLKTKAEDYDLIFMDVQMPIMSGIEATEVIRADTTIKRQPVIIALTANVFEESKHKCMQAGMDGFLGKPISFQQLHDIVVQYGTIQVAKRKSDVASPPPPNRCDTGVDIAMRDL
jgi:CheY-like chemotaxis protein